jgi:H+/Cl- antiporter ClcA
MLFNQLSSFFIRQFRRIICSVPVAILTGGLVAVFLLLLQAATHYRLQHPYLLFLLPLAGAGIYFLYRYQGKNSERGNNLIIEEIHYPGGGVPARMGPLVLASTVITHLFGGSAGREGTAVQIGGSMADHFCRTCHIKNTDRSILLTTGIAAGFGAVFGTPWAGAFFAIEVLVAGKWRLEAWLPCLAAAFTGHLVCHLLQVTHTTYTISPLYEPLQWSWLLKLVPAGVCFGLVSLLFADLVHLLRQQLTRLAGTGWLVPVLGALLLIACSLLVPQGAAYLGLGIEAAPGSNITLPGSFQPGGAQPFSWWWKLLFTAITLGSGFKGGEVTPLFFMGATLGNALSGWLGMPSDLLAGVGFVAVFAGATNTPVASVLMAIELFGNRYAAYYAAGCLVAFYASGHSGIYGAQAFAIRKSLYNSGRTVQEGFAFRQKLLGDLWQRFRRRP